MRATCPNCGSERCAEFYEVRGVPTNSCLLVSDRRQALDFPTGDIGLSFCRTCGFIFNALWQPERTVYSEHYEETQSFSATFNAFHRRLAEELVERYGLYEKDILEIGCGKGEFLSLLCELGRNRGTGYDPSFVPARLDSRAGEIRFVQEFFGDSTAEPAPDFICCKMALEHISETGRFAGAVRRVASTERGTVVFFQVPDVRRILEETAFWDIYYEHCSYFAPTSLAHLFRRSGFEVLRTYTGYDDQYLMIEARAQTKPVGVAPGAVGQRDVAVLGEQIAEFSSATDRTAEEWRKQLRTSAAASRRTVLWGSGSKAVAFLTTLGIRDEIEYVVDINPFRQGRFLPGTGQKIVAPSFLADYRPEVVIIMNPIYRGEIGAELDRQGVSAELVTVDRIRHRAHAVNEPASMPLAV